MMSRYDTLEKELGKMIGFKSSKLLDYKEKMEFSWQADCIRKTSFVDFEYPLLCKSHGKSLTNVIMKGGGVFPRYR